MRIITWNCNMAFRNKASLILALKPDILIVPECEHPDKLIYPAGTLRPSDTLWFGENRNKGLGIFSYSEFRFKVLDLHNENFKTVVPISVSNAHFSFTLLAIWANNPKDPDGQYVTQVWKAIAHYNSIISGSKTILIGDFNSNTIWDRPKREGNHSSVVQSLEKKGIVSTYHSHFNQIQGKEKHPTLYLYRHRDRPYHIDYCFASSDLVKHLQSVEIGRFKAWAKYSDHVPVIVTFNPGLFKAVETRPVQRLSR